MTSDGDKWDPATALNFRDTDSVLVVGNPGFMPWLFSVCRDITSVKKLSELAALVSARREFDRIVIARETQFVHEMVSYAGPLLKRESGSFVVFQGDDGWSSKQAFDFYYPEACFWEIDTTYGRALVGEPRGTSWRFYN